MLGAACHIAGKGMAVWVSRNLGCRSRNDDSRRPSSSAHRTWRRNGSNHFQPRLELTGQKRTRLLHVPSP
jgi:hypothetical protein